MPSYVPLRLLSLPVPVSVHALTPMPPPWPSILLPSSDLVGGIDDEDEEDENEEEEGPSAAFMLPL